MTDQSPTPFELAMAEYYEAQAAMLRKGASEAADLAIERGHYDAERWTDYETALDATSALVDKIEAEQAHTIEGLKIKARAVLWCHSNEPSFTLVCDQNTTDLRLASQVIAGLATANRVFAQ